MPSSLSWRSLLVASLVATACGATVANGRSGATTDGQPFTVEQCSEYPSCSAASKCASGSCIAVDACPTAICISAEEACIKRCAMRQCTILESYPEQLVCQPADPAGERTCKIVRAEYDAELQRVQSCSDASECGQVIEGSSCGCTRNLVAKKQADISKLQSLLNEQIGGERCVLSASTCDCPEADGFACQNGLCAWNYR